MKRINFLLFATLFTLFLILSCNRTPTSIPKDAEWLLGTWSYLEEEETVYESWCKVNKDLWLGKSYTLDNGDTLLYETLHLKYENNNIYYLPILEMNDEDPVTFTLMMCSDQELIFENFEHDFPQQISYVKQNDQLLTVVLKGVIEGKERTVEYEMQREMNMVNSF